MTEDLKCTVGPSAVTGLRCGKPAVVSFVGRDGEVFAECEDHAVAISAPAPVSTYKRGHLVMPVTGSKLRTTRSTRYVAVVEHVVGKPVVVRGSSSIDVVRKGLRSSGVVFDLVTGEIVS